MIYCIDPNVEEPIMLINKHIGFDSDEGMGVDGAIFQQELLALDGLQKRRIQVWINSPGGVVMDGYNIYSAIMATKTPVDTYAMGGVASIAAVIFQAGRRRIMADYAWLMYHNPFGGDNKKLLDTMRQSLVTMIEQRAGMNEEEVGKMLNRTSYILAEEAKTLKLCDEIKPSQNENTKYLKKINDCAEFHKECNMVLNTILNRDNNQKQNSFMFPKVTMRLKLNDAAREDDVLAAIDGIENRAIKAEKELESAITDAINKESAAKSEADKLKAKIKQMEEDKAKNDAELDDCKSRLKAMEEDKQKAEDEAKAEKAKNMVEGFAKTGRIKNEATIILQWSNLAKADFDGTKAMLEALPLNKEAVVITDLEIEKDSKPVTAMEMMVMNKLKREGKI